MKRIVTMFISLILLFLLIFLVFPEKQDSNKLRVAEVTHSIFYAPQYAAISEGYFKDEGIDIELILTPGADKVTAAVLSGDVEIGFCGPEATIYVYQSGETDYLKTFAQLTKKDGSFLVSREKNDNFKIEDLKGKTIYTTGKGTTPEYTLKYLLKKAGLDAEKDVNIEFKSEASEAAAMLASSDSGAVAMLPQPYVTTVMNTSDSIRIALDVTKEWEKLNNDGSTVVTGVIAVNSDYYNNNKNAIDMFMKEYSQSVEYVNYNVDNAAQLVEEFGIFKASVAKQAIPYCNITFITGNQAKAKISSYLSVLYSQNPQSVGGSMPSDDFYGM